MRRFRTHKLFEKSRRCSELINGLTGAAIGAFSMLMSEPMAKSIVKRTYVCPLTLDITLHEIHFSENLWYKLFSMTDSGSGMLMH